MKRVVVGLSGGVDSSVAAYLLKEQGYEVIGLFMKNWHDDSVTISDDCPWEEDSNDALLVADKLGIPLQTIHLSGESKSRIVDYMFAEYEIGRTPNPDVLCNREIKFDTFLKHALQLKADFVATGHYCQKASTEVDGASVYQLLAGHDNNKDQSYFLCQLNQQQLSKALFPIGHLTKPEVRKIAEEQGLITANKKDSQGLCFIGKVRLPDFLQQQLEPKEGKVYEIPADAAAYQKELPALTDTPSLETLIAQSTPFHYSPENGEYKGTHQGAHFFTIGQRKGLGIGGSPLPLFIIGTDVNNNSIYVGQSEEHPGLFRNALKVLPEETHWVRTDLALKVGESKKYMTRIRYRQKLVPATLHQQKDGLYVAFDAPMRTIAPGQFVAWYDGEELIGSGVINA